MYLGSLLIAVILGVGLGPVSEPPSPTPPKAEQKNQTNPKYNPQRPSPDQRGTESSPLFIKVVPPLTIEPRSAEHAEQPNDYTSPEWWLVWVTLILAAITAILAGYTARLWGATKTLAEDAKRTADRQAREMQDSLRIGEKSAVATEESVKLAREEFNLTHRPQIIVRGVSINPRTLEIDFAIANIGGTKATIVQRSAKVWLPDSLENLPEPLPYGEARYEQTSLDAGVGVGQTHCPGADVEEEYSFRLEQKIDPTAAVQSNNPILFIGYFIYEDSLGNKRSTAFMRIYDYGFKRFKRSDNPDYEYQD